MTKRRDPGRSPAVRLKIGLWRHAVVKREMHGAISSTARSLSALVQSEMESDEVIDELQMHWFGGLSRETAVALYMRHCMPHRILNKIAPSLAS